MKNVSGVARNKSPSLIKNLIMKPEGFPKCAQAVFLAN
jgi:hypothetical protein